MKFSHTYLKFCGQMPKRAFLLQVIKVTREDLSEAFVKYDTEYIEAGERSFYPLPDGDLILIIAIDESRKAFTTVRSYDAEKFDYYKGLEGKWVPIERSQERS